MTLVLKGLLFLLLLVSIVGCGSTINKRNAVATSAAEANFPPTGKLLNVAGTQVHLQVEGRGPAIVLIHGAGGNLRDYTFSLMDKLKSRYRVIGIDRPGHGHTGRIPGAENKGESLNQQADLIRAALEEIGVERSLVFGQSFGGAVALAYGLRHPDATAGIITVSGVANVWETPLDFWYRINSTRFGQNLVIPVVSRLGSRKQADKIVAKIFEPDPVPEGYLDHMGVGLSLRPSQLQANTRQVNRLRGDIEAQVDLYEKLTMPVEVVHGTADKVVPFDLHASPIEAQISTAKLTPLDGVGHMPHHAREGEIIAAIDRAAKRAGLR